MQSRFSDWFGPLLMTRLSDRILALRTFVEKSKGKGNKKYEVYLEGIENAQRALIEINTKVKIEGTYQIVTDHPQKDKNGISFHDALDDPHIQQDVFNPIRQQTRLLINSSKKTFQTGLGRVLADSLIALANEFIDRFHAQTKANLTLQFYKTEWLDGLASAKPAIKDAHNINTDSTVVAAPTSGTEVTMHSTHNSLSLNRTKTPSPTNMMDSQQIEEEITFRVGTILAEQEAKEAKEAPIIQSLEKELVKVKSHNFELTEEIKSLNVAKEASEQDLREKLNKAEKVKSLLVELGVEAEEKSRAMKAEMTLAIAQKEATNTTNNKLTLKNTDLKNEITEIKNENTKLLSNISTLKTAANDTQLEINTELRTKPKSSRLKWLGVGAAVLLGVGLMATGIGAVAGAGILAGLGLYFGIGAIVTGFFGSLAGAITAHELNKNDKNQKQSDQNIRDMVDPSKSKPKPSSTFNVNSQLNTLQFEEYKDIFKEYKADPAIYDSLLNFKIQPLPDLTSKFEFKNTLTTDLKSTAYLTTFGNHLNINNVSNTPNQSLSTQSLTTPSSP